MNGSRWQRLLPRSTRQPPSLPLRSALLLLLLLLLSPPSAVPVFRKLIVRWSALIVSSRVISPPIAPVILLPIHLLLLPLLRSRLRSKRFKKKKKGEGFFLSLFSLFLYVHSRLRTFILIKCYVLFLFSTFICCSLSYLLR